MIPTIRISLYIISGFALLLLVQSGCDRIATKPKVIHVYIYSNGRGVRTLEPSAFLSRKPALILTSPSIGEVKLVQNEKDNFTMEIELTMAAASDLEEITRANVGKRLVFVSDKEILIAPRVLHPISGGRIFVEMPSIDKANAEDIAQHFSRSYEFVKREQNGLKKKMDMDCDKKVDSLEGLQSQGSEIALYSEIARCYRMKGREARAAEAYKKLVGRETRVGLDNYMAFAEAYFYLSQHQKRQNNLPSSENYFRKAIEVLKFVIENFPTTKSAEWANLTIGAYQLWKGNIAEAQERAAIAKEGDLSGQGYLLFGLCYESKGKFKEAREEYIILVKTFPDTFEAAMAKEFLSNLDSRKTNVHEFLGLIENDVFEGWKG